MDTTPLRSWAEVDLDRLYGNARRIREHLGDSARLMAVVKADGYGHGARRVAGEAAAAGADFLGVATLEEALHLADQDLPVVVLGWSPPSGYGRALREGIRLTVTDREEAHRMAETARSVGTEARVHVKVDTGMGRLGFAPNEGSLSAIGDLGQLEGLKVEGIFTHLACADEPQREATQRQLDIFQAFSGQVEARLGPVIKHAANTAGLLAWPSSWLDMVRVGLGLYGLYPSPHVPRSVLLEPAMTWKARVAMVKDVPAGTPVSYGHTWRAPEDCRIITISVGYADGYSRLFSDRSQVLVGGRRHPIVGRVCMDQCMALVPEGRQVEPGQEVVLLGISAGDEVSAEELAHWRDTINYEIVTGVGRRVPRVYLRRGSVEGISWSVHREDES